MQTTKFLAVIALIGVANAAVWRNSDGSTNSKICWCTAGGQRLSPCSDVAGQYHNGKFVTASGCSSSWRSGRKLRGGLQSESEAEPTATAKDGLNESESEAEPTCPDSSTRKYAEVIRFINTEVYPWGVDEATDDARKKTRKAVLQESAKKGDNQFLIAFGACNGDVDDFKEMLDDF